MTTWKPGDPLYPFEPDYRTCADDTCATTWSGTSGDIPTTCPECSGPAIGSSQQAVIELNDDGRAREIT